MCCPDVCLSSNAKLWELYIRELTGQKLTLQNPTLFWPGSLNWLTSRTMDHQHWCGDEKIDGWEEDHMAALAEQLKLPWDCILGERKSDMQKY